jgi:hypothetical protein
LKLLGGESLESSIRLLLKNLPTALLSLLSTSESEQQYATSTQLVLLCEAPLFRVDQTLGLDQGA